MARLQRTINMWAALLLLLLAHPPAGQAQEVQVPFTPDSTVYTLDAELRNDLGLFPGVQRFEQAQLFRLAPSRYELVIIYRQDGQRLRERRTLTEAEVGQLRRQIAEGLRGRGTRLGGEQPGRAELLAWTTVLSVTEGGLMVGALDPDNESLAAGLPLLTGAVGFFAPFFATRDRPVTEASGTLTGFGGVQGYAHAVQVAGLLGGQAVDGQTVAGLAAGMGAAEAVLGYHLGATRGWSPGRAEMIAVNGVAGNLLGLGVGITLVGEGDGVQDDAVRARVLAGTSLVGSMAGIALGYRMGRSGTYTRGDARLYSQSGLLAGQLATSLLIVGDLDGASVVGGVLTGAGAAGLSVGAALVRDRDFSTYASNLITLGTYAGSLLGAGLATVANGSSDAVTVLQALGAITGFGITYHTFAPEARRRTASAAETTAASPSLKVRLAPSWAASAGASTGTRLRPRLLLQATF